MKIVIIDDEPLIVKTLERLLRGHDIQVVYDSRDAIDIINSNNPDLIFCDLMMPEIRGHELYDAVCKRCSGHSEKFVFITGGVWGDDAQNFLSSANRRVLYKPFDRKALQAVIDRAEGTQS